MLFFSLLAAVPPSPYAQVEATLTSFTAAVAEGDVATVERLLHPSSVQVVALPGSQMVLDTPSYLGAIKAGKVGGSPIELVVSDIHIQGSVATASTQRNLGAMVLHDAVTLVHTPEGWQIVAMAVQATPVPG